MSGNRLPRNANCSLSVGSGKTNFFFNLRMIICALLQFDKIDVHNFSWLMLDHKIVKGIHVVGPDH